jgi:hypothetical protein
MEKESNISSQETRDDETLSTAAPSQGTAGEDPSDSTGLAGEGAPGDSTGLVGTADPTDSSGLAGSGRDGTEAIYEVDVTVVTVVPAATGTAEDEDHPPADREPSPDP